MHVLVCAHPDDELLFFGDPARFDRIVICFGPRDDKPGFAAARRAAIAAHPFRDKITYLDLPERSDASYTKVREFLAQLQADEVTTHAANGDYAIARTGEPHPDHIACWRACFETLNCRVNGQDPELWRAIRKVYESNGVWTWY